MTDIRLSYNPDVLNCLANLSNDEVFTPPQLANKILDMLPASIWRDKGAKFLDPVSKTGVFLREIAKRLIEGLKGEILDLQERINHIYKNQIYGIAITELTALMSRRALYCSKLANGQYSVCTAFDASEGGNILFSNLRHTWDNGRCVFCGASEEIYDRGDELESYAYQFIHTKEPQEAFNKMKFDVIVGNPPYQLETNSVSRQARPIYPLFIEQAKKLNPRYLTMIIPSRWFSGGMGLDDFRKDMLGDSHIEAFVDYTNAKDCFPQNSVSGGVCYFLWSREYSGACRFTSIMNGKENTVLRDMNEFPVLVRYNEAVEIIRKIFIKQEECLSSIVSSLSPFGLPTNFRGKSKRNSDKDLTIYASDGISYIPCDQVLKGHSNINTHKVMISQTRAEHAGEPGKEGKYKVLTSSMKVLGHGEICTHSYFIAGMFHDRIFAENLLIYLQTKFVRFLILQAMSSIHLSKSVFQFVPMQDFSKPWTDEELYAKYGLGDDEIAFVESMIRPMKGEGE